MARREEGLIIDSLGHSWNAQASPSAGTTCTCSVAPSSGLTRVMLTNLGWSIRNAGAAAFTATLNVRDASIAGTVLASWDMIVGAAASLQDTYPLSIKGIRGHNLSFDFGTPASSVTQKVSAMGWEEKSSL